MMNHEDSQVRVTVSIPQELRRKIRLAASNKDVSLSKWMREVLKDAADEQLEGRRIA